MRLQSHSHKRVLRQIGALTLKNFLIFYKAPISTVLRAFLFPLAIALVFSYLKQILLNAPTFYSNQSGGLSHAFEPIKTLSDAVAASSSKKLVFVLNGTRHEDIDPIIAGVFEQSGLSNGNRIVTDNPDDLFTECRQNLLGKSDCFAAILFTNFNATNVNYTIALNSHDDGILEDYATHQSVTTSHIMPLQWALDSQIGNFTSAPRPLERPFKRVYRYYTSYGDPSSASNERISQWLSIVGYFAASAFILIKIGVVYHLAGR